MQQSGEEKEGEDAWVRFGSMQSRRCPGHPIWCLSGLWKYEVEGEGNEVEHCYYSR